MDAQKESNLWMTSFRVTQGPNARFENVRLSRLRDWRSMMSAGINAD
jgi:hypothetical protein